MMKVAAYQLPVDVCYGSAAIDALRSAVHACEAANVTLLCCPEAALGGLADYLVDPRLIALHVSDGSLAQVLRPLASPTVTAVVGFTEVDDAGNWYNSAVIYGGGRIHGVYRKRHPAIRRSRYTAGTEAPLFTIDGARLGILICRDSTDAGLVTAAVTRGAQILVIPTNNAMPRDRGGATIAAEARSIDQEYARQLGVPIVRADVVGEARGLFSAGSSVITSAGGKQITLGDSGQSGLLIGEVAVQSRLPQQLP